MGVVLLGQQEWGLEEKYGCPTKYGVCSRGPSGVMFLAWAPIFSYGGSSRGPAGVAPRTLIEGLWSCGGAFPNI
jgi:hypothetical protein